VRLAFAGTPATAVPSLRRLLLSPRHEVVAVITRPHARAGRGRREVASPVEQVAADADVPVLTPTRLAERRFLDTLTQLRVDCCPTVAYGALVPAGALAIPPRGWVNLHFSVLPAWRGAAPVPHAILNGDDITGATTFQLEAGLDTGPIYGVVTEPIRPGDTAGDLLARLAESGAELLVATLDGIADGSLQPRPQPVDGASFAPKLTAADARVDWELPARQVDRQVRACTPAPGAWTRFRGERLKLGPVRSTDERIESGQLAVTKAGVLVGTATTAVELQTVQAPGRRAVAAADWARGARAMSGERFA
jgi:methionyl-tRNA formyltransferase